MKLLKCHTRVPIIFTIESIVPFIFLLFSENKKRTKTLFIISVSALKKKQGMRESNSHQRFWRPLSYHLTNPLHYKHYTFKTSYRLFTVSCWLLKNFSLDSATLRLAMFCYAKLRLKLETFLQINLRHVSLFILVFLRFSRLSPRPISNSQLHMLPCFHLCPIYLVVFKGSYSRRRDISS